MRGSTGSRWLPPRATNDAEGDLIRRSELGGLAVALAGHAGLLVLLLTLVPSQAERLPIPDSKPIEVSLADEVALESSAPEVNNEPPAAKLSPVEAPVEPETAAAPPEPEPIVKPKPEPAKPVPAPVPAPKAKPAPEKPAPSAKPAPDQKPSPAKPSDTRATHTARDPRPTGNLAGLSFDAPGDKPNNSKSVTPPAAVSGPVRSALLAELRRMMKPNWRAPTGADDDKLRTWVRVKLRPDGTVADVQIIKQEGKTDLNQAQWELHAERALAAVRKTRFDTTILKDEYYSAWGQFDTYFDKRL